METVIVQINNNRAFGFLENLEALNVIKVLKNIPRSVASDRATRLSEIQSISSRIVQIISNIYFNKDKSSFNKEDCRK